MAPRKGKIKLVQALSRSRECLNLAEVNEDGEG